MMNGNNWRLLLVSLFLLYGTISSSAQKNFQEEKEKEIAYEQLPASVKKSFENGEYADVKRKGVEKVMTEKKGVLYEIEGEGPAGDIHELYYDPDGVLVHQGREADEKEDEEEDDDEKKEDEEADDDGG